MRHAKASVLLVGTFLLAFSGASLEAQKVVGSVLVTAPSIAQLAVNPVLDRVYIGGNYTGGSWPLQVFEVSNPNSPGILTTVTGSGAAANPNTGRFYAGSGGTGDFLVYDGVTNGLITNVHVGNCGGQLAADPGTNLIYMVSQCGGGNDPLYVLDGATNTIAAGPLGSGGVVGHVRVNTATGYSYVARSGGTRVFDASYAFLTDLSGLGIQQINPVTNELYFWNGSGLSVLSGADHSLITTIPTVMYPIGVNTARNRIYANDYAGQQIHIIDGTTHTVVGTFSLGPGVSPGPGGVDTAKNRLYVTGTVSGSTYLYVVDDSVPATAPTGVSLTGPTTNSLQVSWTPGTPNDCSFDSWDVQIVTGGSGTPTGCTGLTNRGTPSCTATGLNSNTTYQMTVAEVCTNSGATSPASDPSPTASTLLLAATAPAAVISSDPTPSSLDLSWTPGAANDCVFHHWDVQMVTGGSGTPAGCTGLTSRGTASCTATGLSSYTAYQMTVAEVCVNTVANSPTSAPSPTVSTLPVPALPPQALVLDNATRDSLRLSWTPGTANECSFASWNVQIVTGGSGTPAGCTALTNRGTLTCTATGLTSNTAYQMTVAEVCTDTNANSVASDPSPAVSTLPFAAGPPTAVTLGNPATDSLDLSWTPGLANECVFDHWDVQTVTGGTGTPAGCTGLTNRLVAACTATGLTSNTEYQMTVAEVCIDPNANSPASAPSPGVTTLPTPAAPPQGLILGDAGIDGLQLSWSAGVANDCVFDHWDVEIVTGGSGTPVGCSGLADRSLTTCSATGLTSNTGYQMTVAEVCTDPAATSSMSAPSSTVFTLPLPATAPTSVVLNEPTVTSLKVAWTAGTAHDCVFDHWDVEVVTGGSGTPTGCGGLTSRAMPMCTATGLTADTEYQMTVAEVCTDPGADSPASVPSSGVSTLPDDDPSTWYVALGGDNSQDCRSWPTACETIAAAIAKTEPGDLVVLGDGVYGENLNITANLAIWAQNPGQATVDGGGLGSTVSVASGIQAGFYGLVIQGGSAVDGGGFWTQGGGLLLDQCTVVGNTATRSGGGIYVEGGRLDVISSTIEDNAATAGGGIYLDDLEAPGAWVGTSTIAGNLAGTGGGLEAWWATVTFESSTLTDNSADFDGEALYARFPATVETHATVLNGSCGGVPPTSLGYNLESGLTCALSGVGDLSGLDAQLQSVGSNGGPTRTAWPMSGSPVIDAGDPVVCGAVDQRGVTRPLDGDQDGDARCDIGSLERDTVIFVDGFELGDTSMWSNFGP